MIKEITPSIRESVSMSDLSVGIRPYVGEVTYDNIRRQAGVIVRIRKMRDTLAQNGSLDICTTGAYSVGMQNHLNVTNCTYCKLRERCEAAKYHNIGQALINR